MTLTSSTYPTFEALLQEVRNCRVCEPDLPLGARPILRGSATARILIVGQAPGRKVHLSGIPWDDPSGERLRTWMGIDAETFYDEARIAIIPMGYCYPGRGKGGDNPPRRECAELWLDDLLAGMPSVETTLLLGQHAQRHFLGTSRKASLTATAKAWCEYAPRFFPLVHPSPRNTAWFQRNAWFENDLVPHLQAHVRALLNK